MPIAVAQEIERAYVEFRSGADRVRHISSPNRAEISTGDVMQPAIRSIGLGQLLTASGYFRRPASWLYALLAGTRLGVDVAVAKERMPASDSLS